MELDAAAQKHPQTPRKPYVFILVGILGLGGVGDGGVAVGAVVFAVIMGCSRVRHDQELLDITLQGRKHRALWGWMDGWMEHERAGEGINTTRK